MPAPALNVIELPCYNVQDVVRGLRAVADQIERGDFGEALNFAWVVDCGSARPDTCRRVECGMLGPSHGVGGGIAHFLFSCAAARLTHSVLGIKDFEDA